MWQIKIFKSKESMQKFIDTHNIQYNVIFINQSPRMKYRPYGIEYRKLRIVY